MNGPIFRRRSRFSGIGNAPLQDIALALAELEVPHDNIGVHFSEKCAVRYAEIVQLGSNTSRRKENDKVRNEYYAFCN